MSSYLELRTQLVASSETRMKAQEARLDAEERRKEAEERRKEAEERRKDLKMRFEACRGIASDPNAPPEQKKVANDFIMKYLSGGTESLNV
jgi:hypothetical protein